jgi:VanZ family protein
MHAAVSAPGVGGAARAESRTQDGMTRDDDETWRPHHDDPENLYRLARHLALCYLGLIVYASLTPFAGWHIPEAGPLAFVLAPFPKHLQHDDLIVNIVAYVPFGALLAGWAMNRRSVASSVLLAVLAAASVSATMETVQSFIPTRVSSNVDLLANAFGAALGACFLGWLGSFERLVLAVARFRGRCFLPGSAIDAGVALLAVWLVAQTNPSLPLFAAGLVENPMVRPWNAETASARWFDPRGMGVALNLCGVLLFASTLGRTRTFGFALALVAVVSGAVLKWGAALFLLKDLVEFEWIGQDPPLALWIGAALFLLCLAVPLRGRARIAAVVLVAGAMLSKLSGNYADIGEVVRLFNWPYSQLLHFTGLTLYLSELWPIVAALYLAFR